jgi:transposase
MSRERDESLWTAWRERLDRFERSGVTVQAFCRREGVSVPSYYQWRRKLRDRAVKPAPVSFLPISLATRGLIGGEERVEIELPSGSIVRLSGVDADTLRVAIEAAGTLPREAQPC